MFATVASSEAFHPKNGSSLPQDVSPMATDGLSDQEREQVLLQWITARCGDDEAMFTFDEGWEVIEKFGLNVLSEMLRDFLLCTDGHGRKERKPLGVRGWSSLYTISYQMVNISITSGEFLYDRICKFIQDYVRSPGVQNTIANANLAEWVAVWQAYKLMTKWIWHLFMHLESSVIKLNEALTLTSAALVSFHQGIYETAHSSLTTLALSMIERERDGEIVDRTLLQETLQVFMAMGLASKIDATFGSEKRETLRNIDSALKLQEHCGLYQQHFEAALLEDTKRYYTRRSADWVAQMDSAAYIVHIDAVLHQEDQRCTAYLNPVTRTKLTRVLLETCIVAHADTLFESVKDILRAAYDNTQDTEYVIPKDKAHVVERLHRFCAKCQSLEPQLPAYALATRLRVAFQGYVVELGLKVVEDRRAELARLAEDSKAGKAQTSAVSSSAAASNTTVSTTAAGSEAQTIAAILRLIQFMPRMVSAVLGDDESFKSACRDAFTSVLNADLGKAGVMHMLASYTDNLLKGNFKVTDTEIDRQLHACMTVFAHLLDKDMYADLHRTHLAKRLLAKRSVSDDAEKLIVGLMKMQCGAQFTSKLEGMLHDYHSAVAAQAEYDVALREWQAAQPREVRQIAFSNTLLTSSHWPTQRPRAFTLPPELRALQAHYAEWYKAKYSVRSLQWVAALGEVNVAMILPGREFELTVALLQAVVLRCFHLQPGALSFEEIRAQSGIDEEEVLKRVLHSLACQKLKILIKGSEAKSLTQDKYAVNTVFANKLRKFRVPMASIEEGEQGGVSRGMLEDRSNAVDASIVRVMKARKVLAHSDLQYEVLRQITGFQPDARLIKLRIESLIERGFLERDVNDARVYKYMP